MTIQEELTLLEAAYTGFLTAGGVQSYTIAGGGGGSRTVTRANADWYAKRIDHLRAAVARASRGTFSVANFRKDD